MARRDAIELEQLADQTLITPNQDFNLSGIILSHLSSLGISCQVQNICSQIDSCLALVNKNMGISFCSRASADYYRYPNVVSVSIKPVISRTVYLVYKKRSGVLSLSAALCTLCRGVLEDKRYIIKIFGKTGEIRCTFACLC